MAIRCNLHAILVILTSLLSLWPEPTNLSHTEEGQDLLDHMPALHYGIEPPSEAIRPF